MERDDLASLAGFFFEGPFETGRTVELEDSAAHHMRVRRLALGDRVYLADGAGLEGAGVIVRLTKGAAAVRIERVGRRARAPEVHLLVPVADRDRMLWLAEKCAELEATSWQPVRWHRSRSVSPRGEGVSFAARVRARMASALEQSHGSWLPVIHPDASIAEVLRHLPADATRLALDARGEPIARVTLRAPVVIAVGPEGGIEPEERQSLIDGGFHLVSVGANVLRFETAAVAALAIVRSAVAASPAALPERTDG